MTFSSVKKIICTVLEYGCVSICYVSLCHVQGCLVVMLLQQWLVCHLTKRIMQLMTPEALTEHCTKIPTSYLKNYLIHQAHFSLNRLIIKYHSGLTVKWLDMFICFLCSH